MPQINNATFIMHPRVTQWLINELPLLVVAVGCLAYAGIDGLPMTGLALPVAAIFSVCLLYRLCYLRRICYVVNQEQLVYECGVFTRSTNYLELFRVIDFDEHQSFMQQLFGLKTVTLHSMDRTTPHLRIIGVSAKSNIVAILRQRVLTARNQHRIHEFANAPYI